MSQRNTEQKQWLIDEVAIQALRDDVRHWKQRAEAAEARAVEVTINCVAYAEASEKNLARAEAAEAQLSALAKQEPSRQALRNLVDVVWNCATESTEVPATAEADKLIDTVFTCAAPPAPIHLPGEKVWRKDTGEEIAGAVGWNDCLAEVKRLNGLEAE